MTAWRGAGSHRIVVVTLERLTNLNVFDPKRDGGTRFICEFVWLELGYGKIESSLSEPVVRVDMGLDHSWKAFTRVL